MHPWPWYSPLGNGRAGSDAHRPFAFTRCFALVWQAVAKYLDLCTLECDVALEAAMHSDDEDWVD